MKTSVCEFPLSLAAPSLSSVASLPPLQVCNGCTVAGPLDPSVISVPGSFDNGTSFSFAVTVDDNSQPAGPSSDFDPEPQHRVCSVDVSEGGPAAG